MRGNEKMVIYEHVWREITNTIKVQRLFLVGGKAWVKGKQRIY
ncbi:hypothetical protein B4064_3444 [Caldibacillus thermoamylovorans]|uniref:Uncharacterized protein n=2 Tax=Caldibacillus thermoamylovorans TaxID=35841 RepID=A0ABD4A722_9BACI|nr:hypothetical protein B4166_3721 [Caldibacillus thermoamylovorans]KIO61497.1 hypothetical protein B4064_3444 [Caldibacillus thermoamylovorans]KIO72711.1 hypothetical protein B4167_2848 [Caldibacillus thermoamylovorans]